MIGKLGQRLWGRIGLSDKDAERNEPTQKGPTQFEEIARRLNFAPRSLNYLVSVDPNNRAVYFETPKVACTAVKAFMQEAMTGKPLDPQLPQHFIHDRSLSPLHQLASMDAQECNEAVFGDTYSRFCFVRDPISRFVSAYQDKYFGRERKVHLHRIGLQEDDEPTLLEVLERMKELDDRQRDIHFMSQHYLLGSGEVDFDYIGRFETFADDLMAVSEKIYGAKSLNLNSLNEFGKRHATGASSRSIGEKETKLIAELYREDFERFDYTVSEPSRAGDSVSSGAHNLAEQPHGETDIGNWLFGKPDVKYFAQQSLRLINGGSADHLLNLEVGFLSKLFIHLLEQAKNGEGNAPDLVEFFSFAQRCQHKSRSQILQDLWVLYMTQEKRNGFFVEFGACDGLSLSNTYLLEREFEWSGILAEPNPAWHDALVKNRSAAIDTDCVYSVSGERIGIQCVEDEPELSRIDTIVPDDVHERRGNRKNSLIVEVPTISLNDLLSRHNAPREIDFMSVDTEGSEYEILKEFDFEKYDVKLFAVENAGEVEKQAKIREIMKQQGYQVWYPEFSRWDDWFYRPQDQNT